MPTKVLLLTDRLDPNALKDAALSGVEGILPHSPTPQALHDFLTRRESLLTPYLPKEEKPAEKAEESKPQGKVIALSSGRGGVGKPPLLVNLAIALAQETREPIAILDLFIGDSLILVNATALFQAEGVFVAVIPAAGALAKIAPDSAQGTDLGRSDGVGGFR